jgi:hypothetical protein
MFGLRHVQDRCHDSRYGRQDAITSFIGKAALQPLGTDRLMFEQKTMGCGKHIRPGDEVFMVTAERNGGQGLYARGVVTEAVRGADNHVSLTVSHTGSATKATVEQALNRSIASKSLRGPRRLSLPEPRPLTQPPARP